MSTLEAAGPNADQINYWNTTAGATWVAMQDALDHEMGPLGLAAMAALAPKPGERLLDIGCGCGDTSLELARRVGTSGAVLGADISAPMLEVARKRAGEAGLAQVAFVQADAQVHPFVPMDAAYSRFGVMFFSDPIAAFANIRRALKPGGRLGFLCWRAMAENPGMTVALAAVRSLLPVSSAPPPPPDPSAPGPFAFADRTRVHGILSGAGFSDIAVEPHDQKLDWGELDDATEVAMRVGPSGAVVREHPDLKPAITAVVRAALAPYATAGRIMLDSATWIVTARNG